MTNAERGRKAAMEIKVRDVTLDEHGGVHPVLNRAEMAVLISNALDAAEARERTRLLESLVATRHEARSRNAVEAATATWILRERARGQEPEGSHDG